MHDFNLGAPVDVGVYDGPTLKGEPIHGGNCEDGVYGCRRCNVAMRRLSFEEMQGFDREEDRPKTEKDLETSCAWCHKTVPHNEISGLRPYDEPSCYYEVCSTCRGKYNKELAEEYEYEVGKGRDW